MKRGTLKFYLAGAAVCSLMLFGCSNTDTSNADTSNTDTKTETEVSENTVSEENSESENSTISSDSDEAKLESDADAELANPYVVVNGVTVKIGDDLSEVIDELGTPDDYQSAKSCTGQGDEKTYTYGGVCIYTTPKDGKDIVYIVELTGSEKLSSGIGIGSTKQEVIDLYGDDYTEDDDYITYEYQGGDLTVDFEFSSDAVTFIDFFGTV